MNSLSRRRKLWRCLMVLLLCAGCGRGARPRASGPLRHEAYVWKRDWDAAVTDSVRRHGPRLSKLVVLGAEIGWPGGRRQIARVRVDYRSLSAARVPVGVALRIGAYGGPFDEGDETTGCLLSVSSALVRATRKWVDVRELQLDFDCAESKLDGYRVWVEAIRRRVHPVPVVITALPSWLDQPAFRSLIAAADGYVLQVHSLERPRDIRARFTLCDIAAARRAVERAARLGVPFRVALPTYGYVLAFDAAGRYLGLAPETAAYTPAPEFQYRVVRAEPPPLADLVRRWIADRPAALTGVIWYRLPAGEELMNWPWPTLAAVMEGRSPRRSLRVEALRPAPALVEVVLVNDGESEARPAVDVRLDWAGAERIASDAFRDFIPAEESAGGMTFRGSSAARPMRPGQRRAVGWVRFRAAPEVRVGLVQQEPR